MSKNIDVSKMILNFVEFLRGHGMRVTTSMVTGAFTFYAGYALTQDVIYAATLVLLSEGLSLWYPFILEGAQEVGTLKNLNPAGVFQWLAAIVGLVLSWVSIVLTDLSSATIIARDANISFGIFTAFQNVPEWAQQTVVFVLPVLGFSHALLLTVFYLASPEAAQARKLRAIERNAKQTIRQANAEARKAQAEAEADEYRAKAFDAARKAGRAKANKRIDEEFDFSVPGMVVNGAEADRPELKGDHPTRPPRPE